MNLDYAEYLLKKTIQDYNLIAEEFSRTRERIWPEMRFLFDEYLIPREKILDIGCGNGRFLEIFKEKKVDYFGVDSSERLIEIAKKRYPEKEFLPLAKGMPEAKGVHKFQVASALNLPFPDNYFDKVYSIAILHHIPSEEFRFQFLKEARRVLNQEGLLILTVWNLWQRKTAWKLLFKHTFLKIAGKSKLDFKDIFYPWKSSDGKILIQRYIHFFTKNELEKLAKKSNFKIKEIGILKRKEGIQSNIYLIAEK